MALLTDEIALAQDVAPALRPGMLCLADRFFPSYELWRKAAQTGADRLWWVRQNARLEVNQRLPARQRAGLGTAVAVDHDDPGPAAGAGQGTGRALSGAVGDRDLKGRVEDALAWRSDRTAQQDARVGSKTPELVEQEFWGLLMAHFAIRGLMHETILREILEERVVSSRNRINFGSVKRKMSNYSLRPRERQPTRRIGVSKQIRIVK